MAALSGNTGNVSGNGIVGILNTWSATISRAMSEVTGFTDAGRNRLLGVYDMSGSAGGILTRTAAFISSNELAAQTAVAGGVVTLAARSNASGTNSIQANVVVDSVTMNSSKTGDATVTFNFNLATSQGTSIPFTLTWTT